MLQRGDSVPHFEVKTIGGELFSYSTIWQRRNLVLLAIPVAESEAPGTYIAQLVARRSEFTAKDAECVVTGDRVPGVQSPAVVVADRWGEIVHVAATSQVDDLTSPEGLLDWVDYLERPLSRMRRRSQMNIEEVAGIVVGATVRGGRIVPEPRV